MTYDVRTGEARERIFDSAKLVEEKNGLAWLSPELGAALKFSFQPLFILLCVTGIHLLLGRNRRPGKEKEYAATLDAVRTGETCLYERAMIRALPAPCLSRLSAGRRRADAA